LLGICVKAIPFVIYLEIQLTNVIDMLWIVGNEAAEDVTV